MSEDEPNNHSELEKFINTIDTGRIALDHLTDFIHPPRPHTLIELNRKFFTSPKTLQEQQERDRGIPDALAIVVKSKGRSEVDPGICIWETLLDRGRKTLLAEIADGELRIERYPTRNEDLIDYQITFPMLSGHLLDGLRLRMAPSQAIDYRKGFRRSAVPINNPDSPKVQQDYFSVLKAAVRDVIKAAKKKQS